MESIELEFLPYVHFIVVFGIGIVLAYKCKRANLPTVFNASLLR